jgi:hypothetical protein
VKTTNKFINLSLKGFLEIADAYTLPTVDGSFGYIMITDGVGNVTWADPGTLALDTNDVTEASNLYFTNERVDDRVAALIQNGTGLTWTYNDPSNTLTGNVSLAPFSTTNLVEGTNLYFTNERVDDRVAVLLQNGTGISWTYNDPANTLTPTISLSPFTTDNLTEGATNKYATNENIDDRVAALIQNGTGLTWTYNDPSNTFTGNVSLAPFSTTNLTEGTNLYFTNERVDDRVAALIQNTATVTWTYNDGANTLEANAASQPIQIKDNGSLISTRSIINFIEGSGISLNIVDNGGTLAADVTISATGGASNPGTLYDILLDGIVIGDADIEHLNFSSKFSAIESPDKYVTIDIVMLLEELSDVVILSPLSNNDVLIYNSVSGLWENGAISIADILDVSISSLLNGDGLIYNSVSGLWENQAILSPSISSPLANGHILIYNSVSGLWENQEITLADLFDVDNLLNPSDGNILRFDFGLGEWITSDGLNTVTLDDVQIGSLYPSTLNFSNKFSVSETIANKIDIDIDILFGEISDISIVSPLTNGDILQYNSISGFWENGPLSAAITLQDTYDASSDGNITTDAIIGAVSIKRGSAADSDIVFETLNGASSTTFSITGEGKVTAGEWNATTVGILYGGTGQTTAQTAINALTQVAAATNEYVLTKDTATGDAKWKIAGAASLTKVEIDNVLVSTGAPTLDFSSTYFSITETPTDEFNISINEAGIDHNSLSNYVANEHIDHTTITITAGDGLSYSVGGSDIASDSTIDLNLNELSTVTSIAGSDFIPFWNVGGGANEKITFTNFLGLLDHDTLLNSGGNKHIDHANVVISAGVGLTGGGDITVNRTLNLSIPGLTALTDAGVIASGDTFAVYNLSATAHEKATLTQLAAAVQTELGLTDGSGTPNYVAKWSASDTLTDSLLQDNGSVVSIGTPVAGMAFSVTAAAGDLVQLTGAEVGMYIDITSISANADGLVITAINGTVQNTGIMSTGSGAGATNYGGHFVASGGAANYAVKLQDGTQGAGKFLKSITANGEANWADITEADITDLQSYALETATLTAGIGLTGGGDLSTNRTFDLDIPGLSDLSDPSIASDDTFAIYNLSAIAHEEVTLAQLASAIVTEAGLVDGSGTADYIPRWTPDGDTLGNSLIRDDGSNLAIGMAPTTDALLSITDTVGNAVEIIGVESGLIIGLTSGGPTPVGIDSNVQGGTTENVGGQFTAGGASTVNHGIKTFASGATTNYGIQIKDGSESIGRFLKEVTGNGDAQWADITESDISDLGSYLPLSGGTMSGNILMDDNEFIISTANDVKIFSDSGRTVSMSSAFGTGVWVDIVEGILSLYNGVNNDNSINRMQIDSTDLRFVGFKTSIVKAGTLSFNSITDDRLWTMPDASGTVALLSDVTALDLATVLAVDNITGGNDIIVSDADVIKAATGGGQLDLGTLGTGITSITTDNGTYATPYLYLEVGVEAALVYDNDNAIQASSAGTYFWTRGGNPIWYTAGSGSVTFDYSLLTLGRNHIFQDADGTIAFLSDVNALDLETVLGVGNTTGANDIIITSGQIIKSSSGGAELNLRNTQDGAASLAAKNDFSEGWLWVGDSASPTHGSAQVAYGQDYLSSSKAIGLIVMNESKTFGTGDATTIIVAGTVNGPISTPNFDQAVTLISTRNSTIDIGVTNSVVIGGTGLTATQDDTVYVDILNINTLSIASPSVISAILAVDANGYVIDGSSRAFNAGIGLTGGGDLSADVTFDLDIPGLTDLTDAGVLAPGDTFVVYNISATAHEEVTLTQLATAIDLITGGAYLPLAGGTMTGNINMSDDVVIDAVNGGGQLDLRNSATDNAVLLSNDGGTWTDSYLYLEPDYAQIEAVGIGAYVAIGNSESAIQISGGSAAWNADVAIAHNVGLVDTEGEHTWGINTKYATKYGSTKSGALSTSYTAHATHDRFGLILNSNNSSILTGVIGSSIISAPAGGLTAKTNYTTYVNQLSFAQLSGVYDGILKRDTLTSDKTWTLPDLSGTLVLGSGVDDTTARWSAGALTTGLFLDDGTNVGVGSIDASATMHIDTTLTYGLKISHNSTAPSQGGLFVESVGASGANQTDGIRVSAGGSTDRNTGIRSFANTATIGTNVGGDFAAASGGTNYAIRLADGTEGTGKFLKSITAIGEANWADITESDISDLGSYLPLAGGQMSGAIDLDGNIIQDVASDGNIRILATVFRYADTSGTDYVDLTAYGSLTWNVAAGALTLDASAATGPQTWDLPDASGTIALVGDSIPVNSYSGTTVNDTPTEIFIGGVASTRLGITNNSATGFKGTIAAIDNTSNDAKFWKVEGLIKNIAGTTTLVGSVTKVTVAGDSGASSYDVTISADDTNDSLKVEVTGHASNTVDWVANIEITEVIK